MSQRESPTDDRGTSVDPLLPPSVTSSASCSGTPLSPTLRQALGLPLQRDADNRPAPSPLPLPQLLGELLTGCSTSLPSRATCATSEVIDALATPDLFLIQGAAGTGKSFAVTRILREAAARGWRVLFLASTPAALDRALLPILDASDLAVTRCLAEGETLEQVTPCLRRTTLTERLRHFTEQTLPQARAEVVRRGEARTSCQAHTGTLEELADVLNREQETARTLEQLQARREALPASVEGEADSEELAPHWAAIRQTRSDLDRQQLEMEQQLARCRDQEQVQQEELGRLKPLLEAQQAGRWWSPNYWRARGKGDLQGQASTLEQSCQELRETALQTQQIGDQLQARLEEQTRAATVALEQLRADLDRRIQQQQAEQTALHERWQALGATLPLDLRPSAPTNPAVAQARIHLTEWLARLDQETADAERHRHELEQASAGLAGRLAGTIPIVAATLGAFRDDPHFGGDATPGQFDLLLLEEAEQATEADLLSVAERARRWVLIGEPPRPLADRSATASGPHRRAARSQRTLHLRPGFFHRLWACLHDDPSIRPVGWRQDLERLVCVLDVVPPDQERWIQPEPVVDHPEVVLHIWSPPRQTPRLVEVEFPAGTPIEDAKAFVYRELDELPLQTRARSLTWTETPERVIVQFGGELPGRSRLISLGEGIFEVAHLLSGHWQTARLEFDRQTWTRDRAVAWVRQRLGLPGHERTLLLDRSQRACPALADWLADLFEEGFRSTATPTPCVEFVSVPSLGDDRTGRRPESAGRGGSGVATLAPRLKSLRGGAGVEINLAEPRRHDLLPGDLRGVLPAQGLVNYLEAQAAVRLVRELLDDPDARAEILAWQRTNGNLCKAPAEPCAGPLGRERNPGIAVLALYPAQVQLIRYLIEVVPLGEVLVEVALPEQMRHRDCAVAVVGLTRSHQHRAVTYGDSPAQLGLALTRPARRLILMGDPGTLLRRSQYNGPVDHLDEAESEEEQTLAGRLVRYLQGHGTQQRAFLIRELTGL